MRALATFIVALSLVASPAIARTGGLGDSDDKNHPAPAKTTDTTDASAKKDGAASSATATKAESSNLEIELQQMRTLLEAQSKQLQEQQERMQALEERLKEVIDSEANSSMGPGASAPGNPIQPVVAAAVQPAPVVVAQEKKPDEAPLSIQFKGVTLTPGGFFAAEGVARTRALSADVNTPFNSMPFGGSSQGRISEFNASGRQSRISMLVEGKLSTIKLSGYYETDFLSAGTTSNDNQSNSYTMRQRQFWAQAALDSGWKFTGGQMWSLVTETKKGVDNRSEALPMVIDAQYTAGFSWARQWGFRVSKNIGTKAWLAASLEESQTTFAGHGLNNNFLIAAPGASGGLYSPLANYSFNPSPDFVLKAAFEPGWGHYEVFGVITRARSRVFPCQTASVAIPCSLDATIIAPSSFGAFNNARTGGGIGANARAPIFHHKADVGIHFLGGSGIGRYGTTGLPDATARPDGTLALIRGGQALGTLEIHATPKLDIYLNAGGEYAARAWYSNPFSTPVAGAPLGYGAPGFNNTGCNNEVLPTNQNTPPSPGACAGDTRNIIEGTAGFWYRFYKGEKGTLQWGPQYSYVVRETWSGTGGQPHAIENMVFFSFRYYIP